MIHFTWRNSKSIMCDRITTTCVGQVHTFTINTNLNYNPHYEPSLWTLYVLFICFLFKSWPPQPAGKKEKLSYFHNYTTITTHFFQSHALIIYFFFFFFLFLPAGKKEKLTYFHDVAMWYVKKTCSKDALTPTGSVFGAGKGQHKTRQDKT